MSLNGSSAAFDPLLNLQKLYQELRTKIKQKQINFNTLLEVISNLRNIYLNIADFMRHEDPQQRKQIVNYLCEKMGYSPAKRLASQTSIEPTEQGKEKILSEIVKEMILAFNDFLVCKDIAVKWEPVYIELQRLILDNENYIFKKFQKLETTIYTLLAEEIVKPHLEKIFLQTLPDIRFRNVPPNPVQVDYIFIPSHHKEFKSLIHQQEITKNITKYIEYPLSSSHSSNTQIPAIQHELEILQEESHKLVLLEELHTKFTEKFLKEAQDPTNHKMNIIIGFHSYYCHVRFCFALAEEANKVAKKITEIQNKIDSLMNGSPSTPSKLNKRTTAECKKKGRNKSKRKVQTKRSAKVLPGQTPINNIMAYDPNLEISTANSSEEELIALLDNVSLTAPSEPPPASLSPTTLIIPVDHSLSSPAAPQAILPAFRNQLASLQSRKGEHMVEAKDHATQVNKVLERIFELSPKLRYTKLINFVENRLAGKVNTGTGSSLNKFKITQETLNPHKRHGRDRKQFADVNVVKEFKTVLISLGIVPNNYRNEQTQLRKDDKLSINANSKKEEMAAYIQALQEVINVEPYDYHKKLQWLKEKWNEAQDSEIARELGSIGKFPLSVVSAAIIADNEEYFWAHRNEVSLYKDLQLTLERACLFGSRKIAESILVHMKSSFSATENSYLLGYICASNNYRWMQEVALEIKQAGVELPDTIYDNYVPFKIRSDMRAIFAPDNQPRATEKSKL